ncbi:8688_t:CDS:2 [Paraglomus occultum]|uniref:Histone H1 n=1 Tax=Paraglomus occultum TaxID=144539 RepID=A0A9N8ZTY3_9GLOM|nr:8688_t:CDS:2 [Paraglomus occultum]
MGPKKAQSEKSDTQKKSATKKAPEHPPYKEMISAAIHNLKERNGSSRQAIKKYIHANYKSAVDFPAPHPMQVGDGSDGQINLAIKRGVANGDFLQPKGPSGPVKINKKPSTAKKEAPKKEPTSKKETKKAAPKKKTEKKPERKKTETKAAPKKTKATPARKVTKRTVSKTDKSAAKTEKRKKTTTSSTKRATKKSRNE